MHKPADQHWGGGTGLAIGTPGRDNSWVDPFRSVGILVRIDGPNQSAKINRWPPKKILNKREPRARTFARTYRVMSLPWYSRGGLHIMEPSHMASSLSWCTYSHTAPCSNCSVASRPGVGGTVLTSAASSQPHDDHNVRSCPCDSQPQPLLRVPQPLALGGRPVRRGHTRAPPPEHPAAPPTALFDGSVRALGWHDSRGYCFRPAPLEPGSLGGGGGPRGHPCGGEMGSHGPPQAPIFSGLFSFCAIFYLFSWEFAVLAAMLSRLATACRRC